jgi:hypothetical protein
MFTFLGMELETEYHLGGDAIVAARFFLCIINVIVGELQFDHALGRGRAVTAAYDRLDLVKEVIDANGVYPLGPLSVP